MDRHQEETNSTSVSGAWSEAESNFTIAKTEVINSGYALMGELNNFWSVLSEGLKVVGDEVKKEATKSIQSLAVQMKNKIYSPWMDQGIRTVNNILGKN